MEKAGTRRRFLLFAQFAVILAPFTLFFDAAMFFRGRINLSVYTAAAIFSVLNMGLILLIALAGRYFFICSRNRNLSMTNGQRAEAWSMKKKQLLSFIPVTIVSGIFSVLALLQFSSLPRYDGGLYYDALLTATEKFIFTPDSLVSSFTFFTHPMQGTSLLIGMGEMLFPRQVVGVYGVTLLLTIISIFCLYKIYGRIFPDKPAWLKAAGTAVFAFCPYLLGLFSHISPDYYSLMFFILLIYSFSEELDYLAGFMTVLLVFSKETGILFAAAFLVPAILFQAGKAQGRNYISKLVRYLVPKRLLLYSLAPLLFLYKALVLKSLTYGQVRTNDTPLRWDNNGVFCFGFNFEYFSTRMAQFVFTNFLWIITLLAITAIILVVIRKQKGVFSLFRVSSTDKALVAGIAASTIAYTIFACLFITTMCPRYNVLFALPASLICIWAVSNIWENQTLVKITMGVVILLFLLQSYFNLDPSLYLGNHKINMGYEYICSPTANSGFMDLSYIGETCVYNRTYTYCDDLLEQAMVRIKPDDKSQFVTVDVDWYETYLIGDPNQTKHLIYWDPISMKRTYDYRRKGIFLPRLLSFSSADITSPKELDLPADFFLILTAKETETLYSTAMKSRGYDEKDSFVVSNYLGYLTIVHFVHQT